MCTILVASRLRADLPLIVAANRDEFLDRPALPPRQILPGVFAGTDVEKGGTWLGASTSGLFVGLTNQHSERGLPVAPRSRGEVVLGALQASSLDDAIARVAALDPSLYSPFNLLLGDASRLFIAYSWRGPTMHVEALPPGLHVLANDCLRSPLYPKTLRAEALVSPHLGAPWPELRSHLATMLADHELPPPPPLAPVCDEELRSEAPRLQALCVHTSHRYGTRSSAILSFSPSGLVSYDFADGSPCTAPFAAVVAR